MGHYPKTMTRTTYHRLLFGTRLGQCTGKRGWRMRRPSWFFSTTYVKGYVSPWDGLRVNPWSRNEARDVSEEHPLLLICPSIDPRRSREHPGNLLGIPMRGILWKPLWWMCNGQVLPTRESHASTHIKSPQPPTPWFSWLKKRFQSSKKHFLEGSKLERQKMSSERFNSTGPLIRNTGLEN